MVANIASISVNLKNVVDNFGALVQCNPPICSGRHKIGLRSWAYHHSRREHRHRPGAQSSPPKI
jgi:hypothetical protein